MPNKEGPISRLRRFRKITYESAKNNGSYTVTRGIDDYYDELPELNGKSFIRVLDDLIRTGNSVSVLDIGCGAGMALIEMKNLFPNIETAGISAQDFRNHLCPKYHFEEKAQQIDYRLGDAQKIAKVFQDKKFDLILSCTAFLYFGDRLSAVRQAYKLLKPDGTMFLTDALQVTPPEAIKLQNYWQNIGIESEIKITANDKPDGLEIRHIVVRKNPNVEKLPMPFTYKAEPYLGVIPRHYKLTLP